MMHLFHIDCLLHERLISFVVTEWPGHPHEEVLGVSVIDFSLLL